jgi:hypothetical protein
MLRGFVCCNGGLGSTLLELRSTQASNQTLQSGARIWEAEVVNGGEGTNRAECSSNMLAPMGLKPEAPLPNCLIEISSAPQLLSIFEVEEDIGEIIGERACHGSFGRFSIRIEHLLVAVPARTNLFAESYVEGIPPGSMLRHCGGFGDLGLRGNTFLLAIRALRLDWQREAKGVKLWEQEMDAMQEFGGRTVLPIPDDFDVSARTPFETGEPRQSPTKQWV